MVEATRVRKRRGSLSRDAIIDAAMRLLDSEGESALTFVRLGEDLEASSTAVYRHFASRDDLVKGISDRLDGFSLEGYEPTDDWRRDLEDLADRAWQLACKHPAASSLAMGLITGGMNELRAVDAILRALVHAGLRGRDAVLRYQVFANMVLDAASTEGRRLSRPDGGASQGGWVQVYTPTDPTAYPYAEQLKTELKLIDPEEVFRMQVAMFLESVELAVRSPRSPTPDNEDS